MSLVREGIYVGQWAPHNTFRLHVSALRQVIAWDKARGGRLAHDFGFPPAIVLMSEDSQDVTLGEPKLLGNGSSVTIHSSS